MNRSIQLSLLAALLTAGFTSQAQAADSPEAQRAEIRKMCDAALATLVKAKPKLKTVIAKSPGYGCFSSFGVTLLVGGAGGRGLVHNNATGKTTFMNMGQASAGLEVGIKDYREVLVFHDAKTLNSFVENGWELTATGGGAAAVEKKGGSAEGGASLGGKISIFPMTETGLSAGGSLGGRKYWKDKELN
ncbi:MAG: YSC84-related protein [Betaproteobacteria bacterium]|nr:YSC84-related protein [Betaproteobacteria bacterium]